MALLSKKEFADKCGMTTRELAVYISRKKVLIGDGDQIDDTQLINSAFSAKHSEKKMGTQASAPEKKSKPTPQDKKAAKQKEESINNLHTLEKEKKALDIEKTRREVELLNDKRDKQRGKFMPIDILKPLLTQHFKDITIAFTQGVDGMLAVIYKKTKLNVNDQAALRMEIIQLINESVNKSIDATQKSVNIIVKDISEQRGVGERV